MSEMFGERLRRLRSQAGLSQAELAGDGLSASYISLLEAGKRQPSREVVQQLSARLGISSTQLWDGRYSEREERVALEQAYAKLAVEHGEAASARRRLEALLDEDGLPVKTRDDLLWLLGVACSRLDDTAAAARVFGQLFDRAASHRDTHIPITLIGVALTSTLVQAGDLAVAVAKGEECLAVAQKRGLQGTDDYFRVAAVVMDAHMRSGNFLTAKLFAEPYVEEARQSRNASGQAALLWNQAVVAEQQGNVREAIGLLETAAGQLELLGTDRDTPRLQVEMAHVLLSDEPPQVERARHLLEQSADAMADLGSPIDRAVRHWLASKIALFEGDPAVAADEAQQSLPLTEGGSRLERATAFMTLADALWAEHRDDEADTLLTIAMQELAEVRSNRVDALVWRELGERLIAVGRMDDAIAVLQAACDAAGLRSRIPSLLPRIEQLRAGNPPAAARNVRADLAPAVTPEDATSEVAAPGAG